MEKNYLKIAGNIHLSYYVEAADELGIDCEILVHGLLAKFSHNGKSWFIINTVTPLNNTPSCTIAKRKNLTNMILEKAGIPVPKQIGIQTEQEAIEFFSKYKSIVIKPTQAIGGHGVSVLPSDEESVRLSYNNAHKASKSKVEPKVIAEQFIMGDNYRLLVLADKVIGVVRRIPAFVVGDGKRRIRDLVEEKNKIRDSKLLQRIVIDSETDKRLGLLGKTLESVPLLGQEIPLRFNANLTTGGSSQECAAEVNSYYIDLAIRAVKTLGLTYAGVDLITPDITEKADCAINEINYNPGLRLHYKPDKGSPVKVAVPVMEHLVNY